MNGLLSLLLRIRDAGPDGYQPPERTALVERALRENLAKPCPDVCGDPGALLPLRLTSAGQKYLRQNGAGPARGTVEGHLAALVDLHSQFIEQRGNPLDDIRDALVILVLSDVDTAEAREARAWRIERLVGRILDDKRFDADASEEPQP